MRFKLLKDLFFAALATGLIINEVFIRMDARPLVLFTAVYFYGLVLPWQAEGAPGSGMMTGILRTLLREAEKKSDPEKVLAESRVERLEREIEQEEASQRRLVQRVRRDEIKRDEKNEIDKDNRPK